MTRLSLPETQFPQSSWIDSQGQTFEEVYDVGCSGGATVDPGQRAFYDARALENPTCRWSTWDAIRAGVPPLSDFSKTLQERAWSSPIQYRPAKQSGRARSL